MLDRIERETHNFHHSYNLINILMKKRIRVTDFVLALITLCFGARSEL